MSPEVEALLQQVAARDPDKAAYLRWVYPQLKDDGLAQAARQFLESAPTRRVAGPKETLLEMDLDPDGPTGMYEAMGGEEGEVTDEPTSERG